MLKYIPALIMIVAFLMSCGDNEINSAQVNDLLDDKTKKDYEIKPKKKEYKDEDNPFNEDFFKAMFNQQNSTTNSSPVFGDAGIFKVYKNNEIKKTFADVAGLEAPKKSLQNIIDYLKDPKAFRRLGAEPPTGVIFYGPPGTGKTEIARALAGEVSKARQISFIVASGASFENKYVGVGADNVRKLFELARRNKPAIIFIDEFDALAGKRSEERKNAQVVNQLLTELDGFSSEDRADIFLIAATNLIKDIDPAVIRPGRIDRKIEIGLPDDVARQGIIEHYLKKEPEITGIDINWLVASTAGWSAAELKTWVNEARIVATINNSSKVERADFDAALIPIIKARADAATSPPPRPGRRRP